MCELASALTMILYECLPLTVWLCKRVRLCMCVLVCSVVKLAKVVYNDEYIILYISNWCLLYERLIFKCPLLKLATKAK